MFANIHLNAIKNNCHTETVRLFIKDKSVINNTPLQGIYNYSSLSNNTVVNKFTGSNSEVENLGGGVFYKKNCEVTVNNDLSTQKRVDYRHENDVEELRSCGSVMVKTIAKEIGRASCRERVCQYV